MIIHEPEVKRKDGEIIVSSKIERDSQFVLDWPDHLYFAFPEKYQGYLKISLDPFLFSMLIPAMRLGENIHLRGLISARLAFGLQEYQTIFRQAHRNWARHPVEIEYAGFTKRNLYPDRERFGATSFSGGVDSTFSCWLLKEEQQKIPYADLKYALFIHGVDNPLNDRVGFEQLAQRFSTFLQPKQIDLITPRTNFILFSQFLVPWVLVPQVPLLASAMLLQGLINRFFIPSAYSYDRYTVTGSSFLSDHWIATEDLEVIHPGRFSYVEKLAYVNQIPGYDNILRVCANKKHSLRGNCGICNKCLRTMVFLALMGEYSKYKSFPQPFSHSSILKWGWHDYGNQVGLQNFTKLSWKTKKYNFFILGLIATSLARIQHALRTLLRCFTPEKLFLRLKQKMFIKEEDVTSEN